MSNFEQENVNTLNNSSSYSIRPKKDILHISCGHIYLALLFNPKMFNKAFKFLCVAIKKFFVAQFKDKAQLKKGNCPIPLKNIEHDLDKVIPIDYNGMAIYKTFVTMWIRAASFFRHHIGKSFEKPFIDFLEGLSDMYNFAYSVYSKRITTTKRPKKAPDWRYKIVYAFDPHLFCVPSLHVMVVCYTYYKFAQIIDELGQKQKYQDQLDLLFLHAIRVIESILYVRQHSVNCIPAALYSMGIIIPEFSKDESYKVLSSLFENDSRVDREGRLEAINYMKSVYDNLLAGGTSREQRSKEIIKFIDNYIEITNN